MKKLSIWAPLALAAIALAVVYGCGKAEEPSTSNTPNSTTPATASVVDFTNDKGQLVCPVTGQVIADKSKATGFEDYGGKRYYFCCGMCPPEFKKDPTKWAEGKAIKDGTTLKM